MIREAIGRIVAGESLTADDAAAVMEEIMEGQATQAQIGAFLIALRLKGETIEEMTGLARVMRSKATPVRVGVPTIDTCGTGGDGLHTFNVSTAVAFVLAGAGCHVAKHGNRAMSSHCGSADVLEALGARIDLGPEEAARSIEEVGMAFMFAPLYHPAMRHANGPRRELGVRTIFNVLGPLTNPASAQRQLLGVPSAALAEKMAATLNHLGAEQALVVYGHDGTDELSITGPSEICEVRDGAVRRYTVSPEDVGLARASGAAIAGGTAEENARILREIFAGAPGPRRDVVVLNAAAGLLAAGKADDLRDGVRLAQEVIDRGAALDRIERFVAFSQQVAPVGVGQ